MFRPYMSCFFFKAYPAPRAVSTRSPEPSGADGVSKPLPCEAGRTKPISFPVPVRSKPLSQSLKKPSLYCALAVNPKVIVNTIVNNIFFMFDFSYCLFDNNFLTHTV